MTILIKLIQAGHCTPEIVKILAADPSFDINAQDDEKNTALIWAVRKCQTEMVPALLAIPDINVDVQDNSQRTALFWAVYYGQTTAVQALLAVPGINVNAQDFKQKLILKWARYRGYTKIVELLETHSTNATNVTMTSTVMDKTPTVEAISAVPVNSKTLRVTIKIVLPIELSVEMRD